MKNKFICEMLQNFKKNLKEIQKKTLIEQFYLNFIKVKFYYINYRRNCFTSFEN